VLDYWIVFDKDCWGDFFFFFSNSKKLLMWYKIKRIYMKSEKKLSDSKFFYLNSNKKIIDII
jgi:hypothetical protein